MCDMNHRGRENQSMAGGMIPESNVALLGEYPESCIIQLFLEELEDTGRLKHL